MKQILLVCAFLFLCSCGQSNGALRFDTFRDVPKEITAGSFFAETQGDLDKGNYLFVQDYDTLAFMMVNGKMVKLRLSKSVVDSVANTLSEVYERDEYTVKLNAHYVNDDGNKDYDFEGKVTVGNNRGDSVTRNIFGYDLVE